MSSGPLSGAGRSDAPGDGAPRRLRAAVIGCGDVASVHFEALAAMDDVELVAVVGPTAARREEAARRWGIPSDGVFEDHRTMLETARPDVVHIATPHAAHVDAALDAIAAGVDVLIEKPLAHTLADGERIAEAARGAAGRVGVCFQNRYNATSRELRRVLDAGELGRVLGASGSVRWFRDAAYFAAAPWRGTWAGSGGGVLMNQSIHTLDLLLWLLGDAVEVAGGVGRRALDGHIEVEDTADIALLHDGGVRSTFFATNTAALNFPVQLEVQGEAGRMVLDGALTVAPAEGPGRTVRETAPLGAGRSYWGASHAALIRDFYDGHGSGEPFWIGPEEALKSLRVIKQVYAQALAEGEWV
ncbi:Gfo/Idh/MocA family protein [Zafaria sp. Z1313]|uniref:Gfo/Idh/MocA family protein n=1 Tax=unclassified Zafaria TaxID=2828765 RepID=UPI002E78FEF4|nr:Gfo/Idh/MocA family oxidoreductase [Zafaria sp. J156]MEE1621803.1 Gfo/Idh/MocA family oxidoreductase [Zafaria sp. J156]